MSFVNPDSIHRASVGAIAPAVWGDTVNDDLNYLYGDAVWTDVAGGAFLNSWVNVGSPYHNAGYRKIGSTVFLRGQVIGGTFGVPSGATAITILPPGYRPSANMIFPSVSNLLFGSLHVYTTGNVYASTGESGHSISLDNCQFDIL
jgi:hypothetical protein